MIRNAFDLSLAKLINAGAGFLLFAFIGVSLSTEMLGAYYSALSISTLGIALTSFITIDYIFLSFVKDRNSSQDIASNWIFIRILLSLFLILLLIVLGLIGLYTDEIIICAIFCVLMISFDSITEVVVRYKRALLKTQFEVKLYIFRSSARLITAIIFVYYLNFQIIGLSISLALVSLIVLFFCLYDKERPDFQISRINIDNIVKFIKGSAGFLFFAIVSNLITEMDMLILASKNFLFESGLYAIGKQFFVLTQLIPLALSALVIIRLRKILDQNPSQLIQFLRKLFLISMLISIAIAVIVWLVYDNIISTYLRGSFVEASKVVQIMIVMTSLRGTWMMYSLPLFQVSEKMNQWTFLVSISAIFHLVLSLFLVTDYGAIGCAVAFLISEILLLFMSILASNRIIKLYR